MVSTVIGTANLTRRCPATRRPARPTRKSTYALTPHPPETGDERWPGLPVVLRRLGRSAH